MQKNFESLPAWLRQAAVTALGLRNRFLRYRGDFRPTLEFLSKSADWTVEHQHEWQRRKLVALVESARTGCVYYRDAFAKVDLATLSDQPLFEALQTLPTLAKEKLKSDPEAFQNRNTRRFTESSTSGSTGSPTRVEHDLSGIQKRFAFQADHLSRAGTNIFEPSIRLSGRLIAPAGKTVPDPWIYNLAERQLFISSYHLDPKHAAVIQARVSKLQPRIIDGYPSAILTLVRLLAGQSDTLASVHTIVTTAETLQDEVRQELQHLSGALVLDYYSASEGLPFIQQCEEGTYHVRWQSGILEVLSDTGVHDEGDGEIVATSFVQDRTPLIRYRTGDLVSGLSQRRPTRCACGLRTPTVEGVVGRVEDLIYTPDGRAIGMFTYRTLKYIEGLQEAQVIQDDYTSFRIKAVLMPGFEQPAVSDAVKESFERALGYEISLGTEIVSALPKGPNGKVRLVMSRVADGKTSVDR